MKNPLLDLENDLLHLIIDKINFQKPIRIPPRYYESIVVATDALPAFSELLIYKLKGTSLSPVGITLLDFKTIFEGKAVLPDQEFQYQLINKHVSVEDFIVHVWAVKGLLKTEQRPPVNGFIENDWYLRDRLAMRVRILLFANIFNYALVRRPVNKELTEDLHSLIGRMNTDLVTSYSSQRDDPEQVGLIYLLFFFLRMAYDVLNYHLIQQENQNDEVDSTTAS